MGMLEHTLAEFVTGLRLPSVPPTRSVSCAA